MRTAERSRGAAPARPGVLVLGMHRSGTSAVAGVLHRLGLEVGPAERLVRPDGTNPNGHWEVGPLVVLNDRLLEVAGGAWDRLPERFDLTAWPAWAEPAGRVFTEWQPAAPWVWKDPRLCLLLPFWRRLFPWLCEGEPAVVLCLRNPLEIAASLGRRNGIPPERALSLWESYLRSALAALEGLPVLCSWYDDLLADPGAWVLRTREFLAGHGIDLRAREAGAVTPPALTEVDARFRHHRASAREAFTGSRLSARQKELFGVLRQFTGVPEQVAV